ncbi:KAP family P-loop NTPase fold protein [Alkalihalobacillus deserti]|uniref:KAP family P-loop NTPase fold protein n=1 Tax=Alkalihalobacillus deserti TaxID=2879466 RepID=UPI001D145C46|nr:P-loop NTPase fold protein [Alkalihalobacillus deserti]
MKDGYFLKDTALMDKTNDAFHHEDYVKNMKTIIEEHDPPYNIALIGKWGVGKSSIINLLKKELQGKPEIETHEINAWKYENDSLKKAFLKNLWQTFNKQKDVSYLKLLTEPLRETSVQATVEDRTTPLPEILKSLGQLIMVFLVLFLVSSTSILLLMYLWDGIIAFFTASTFLENASDTFDIFKENIWVAIIVVPLYKLLQEVFKSSIQSKTADVKLIKPIETADEYEELFKKAIANHKKENPKFKKLVVIVDDLDRLSTKKVVAALDAIKAFVEINECIFIVTCDESILINAIEKEKLNNSNEIDGDLFLDKLFHFRIPLPPIIENDMSDYAINIAKQEAPGLVKLCNGQFEEIIDILIHAEVNTPRQVKKLLNTLANNLLIANSRESDGRKLEQQLLTGKKGIRFLAKLSVLQSDYDDIYMNLGKDFNYLEDLMNFYYGSNKEDNKVKPSIKRLFIEKNSTYEIKPHYVGLINFLSRTQHITVDNIAPFIYLAQDAIGLKAGDEKQRAIRKNLISGNEKEIISMLQSEPNSEHLIDAIIEEVKRSTRRDLPSVIKASIQLINHIKDKRIELANVISYQLKTIDLANIRFWQVEQQNVLTVYQLSENKNGIENALVFILDELFSRSDNWKKPQGKEMSSEDFVADIVNVLGLLLSASNKLPSNIKEKVKSLLALEHPDYAFFPFESIHSLYQDHKELYNEYFNLSFFNQLIADMEDADKHQLFQDIATFLEIAPVIRVNYPVEFVESIPQVIAHTPASKVVEILRLLFPIIGDIKEQSGSNIVGAITDFEFEDEKEVLEVVQLIQKIPFSLSTNDDFTTKFDTFVLSHLNQENDEKLDVLIKLMEQVIEREETDFSIFNEIFNYVVENVMEQSYIDKILERVNGYFTKEQRTKLFNKINPAIISNTYNASLFDRVYALFALLCKDEANHSFIEKPMQQGISTFQNHQWNQKQSWASDFVKLFSAVGHCLSESVVTNFINGLNNNVSNQGRHDLVIKAYMHIGQNAPESKVVSMIEYVMNQANSDATKLDGFEFLSTSTKFITKQNENLQQYANFLVDNLSVKVGSFLSELFEKFRTISKDNTINLVKNIAGLTNEQREANKSVINSVIERFFQALNADNKKAVFYELLRNLEVNIVHDLLLNAIERDIVISLLDDVIRSNVDDGNEYKGKLLRVAAPYHSQLDKAVMTNLIVDILRNTDDDFIIEMCDILLTHYNSFRFGREKKHIASQIIPTFRNVNIEAKEKVLEIAKFYYLEKEFEQAIKDKLLSQDEEAIVFKKFGFRKNRFVKPIL